MQFIFGLLADELPAFNQQKTVERTQPCPPLDRKVIRLLFAEFSNDLAMKQRSEPQLISLTFRSNWN
jgi:hypothetical protein